MVSWDAQVFIAVVSALLAFPGTEVTKPPREAGTLGGSFPLQPAMARLVPDSSQTLQSFPVKDKGVGDQERGAKLSPREGRGQRGDGENKGPWDSRRADRSQEAGRTSRRNQFPRLTCQQAWV